MGGRGFYRPVSRDEVIREYTAASNAGAAFQRAKWGSEESMLNRFRFALRLLSTFHPHSWLDIGCGEADFFTLAEEQGHRFDNIHGLDITPAMVERARQRGFFSPVTFTVGDISDAPKLVDAPFDRVTLLGVLQQCGMSPAVALEHAAGALKKGGRLFLTTKHLGWEEFTSGRLKPEPSHSWFTCDEVESAVRDAGMKVVRSGGYLPREDREVPVEQSHTLYVLATR